MQVNIYFTISIYQDVATHVSFAPALYIQRVQASWQSEREKTKLISDRPYSRIFFKINRHAGQRLMSFIVTNISSHRGITCPDLTFGSYLIQFVFQRGGYSAAVGS